MHPAVNKYLSRTGVAVLIYAFLHFTRSDELQNSLIWENYHWVHLGYVIVVVLFMWEITDRIIRYFERHYIKDITTWPRLLHLLLVDALICLPLVVASSYFAIFYMDVWLLGYLCPYPNLQFWQMVIKGEVMVCLVIAYEIIKLYYRRHQSSEHEKAFIQKELLASQFQSLKNQVNPHFLFNSFSVLDSLIHDDPKLASDFLGRLSKMYRYMLDHEDRPLVSLAKEFEVLESYLFLLKTRHEDSPFY